MTRERFPRIYELLDPKKDTSDGFDFEFKIRAADSDQNEFFIDLESNLQGLDAEAWAFLRAELSPLVYRRNKERVWQPLFDRVNEVRAYNYVKGLGYTNVSFIPRAKKKTPELQGIMGDRGMLCEVKTINISQEELVIRRPEIYTIGTATLDQDGRTIGETKHKNKDTQQVVCCKLWLDEPPEAHLNAAFLEKLRRTIEHAVDQLKDYDPQHVKQWILYMVISFDERWGEFAGNYFQEIRLFLSTNHVPGLQIVINHVKNTGIPRLEIEYP